MAIRCPDCGAEYDVTLFVFGRMVHCDCGAWVDLSAGHRESNSQVKRWRTGRLQHPRVAPFDHNIPRIRFDPWRTWIVPNGFLALQGFVDSFQSYDVLVRPIRSYGYAYPFIELGLVKQKII